MKLLYFADSHLRGTSPKNRKDDFLQTLITKMEEIGDIAKREKVDYIIHGGDLFDRPDVSVYVVGVFSQILNSYNIPIYMISGNHDIFGHNPKTIKRTMLGLLDSIGIVNLINDKKVLLQKGDVSVELSGAPYIFGNDDLINKDRYKVKEKNEDVDYQVHVTHGFLVEKAFIPGVSHTVLSEISDTKADITLGSHYHYGFKNTIIDGKYFLNPGSIVRISNSTIEMDRKPKILIIELGKEISVKDVYLKSAQPSEEVLDRTEIEKHKFKSFKINEFKDIIESSADYERIDIYQLLTDMALNEKLPEDVVKEAIERVEKIELGGAGLL